MSKFFRKEVIDYKKNKLSDGDVALPNTFSLKILIFILILLIVSILIFFIYGSYTERRTVTGYLTPVKGVVKILSPVTGVVDTIEINNNKFVNKNDDLLTITSEQYSKEGKYSDIVKKNLEEQLNIIDKQIALAKENIDQRQEAISLDLLKLHNEKKLVNEMIDNQLNKVVSAESIHDSYLRANSSIEGAISRIELKNAGAQVDNLKNELASLKQDRNRIENQISHQKVELDQIATQTEKDLNDLQYRKLTIEQSLLDAKNNVSKVIKSPASGKIAVLNVSESQIVDKSQLLLSIIPSNDDLKANILIPPSDIGFIKIGSDVEIRYDSFPYQKYGQAKGKIVAISKTTIQPTDITSIGGFNFPTESNIPASFYIADVSLDHQYFMVDGNRKNLETGMTLKADIKLENRKLYQWILEPLIGLRQRNK